MPSATLSNLPLELKMEVVHHLELVVDSDESKVNKRALQALSRVSSNWHSLVAPALWAVLDLRKLNLDDLRFCAATVAARYGKHVKGICMTDVHHARPGLHFPTLPAAEREAYLVPMESQLPQGAREVLLGAPTDVLDGYLETFLHVIILQQLPILQSIAVDYTFGRKDEPYEELLRAVQSLAPQVRELALTCDKTVDTSIRQRIAETWLAPFTAVSFLHLNYEEADPVDQEPAAPAIPLAPLPLIQAFSGMTKLEHLELDNEALLSPELARADWSRVPLKSLDVSLGRSNSDGIMSPSSLLPLITQLGSTLEYLDITTPYVELPSPALPLPLDRPPPAPLQKLSLPHLTTLHLDVLDPTGAFISSFANCPITRLVLNGCAIGTPIATYTTLVDGSWKPTLRHITLPHDDPDHFQPLKTLASRNLVTVEFEEDFAESDESEEEQDEFGYDSEQERYNDLMGYGDDFGDNYGGQYDALYRSGR